MTARHKTPLAPAYDTILTKKVEQLVRRFEAATLPRVAWTHQAHVEVGLWYVLSLGLAGATRRMRRMVRRYNAMTGATARERAAYHETITVHWLWTIEMWRRRNAGPRNNWHVLFRRLEADPIMQPGRIFRQYSADLLFSAQARLEYVAPDVTPLPRGVVGLLDRISAQTQCSRRAA